MLGADVVVPHATGFFDRQLQHLLGRRRQLDLAAGMPADAGQPLDRLFDPGRIEAELAQNAPRHPALFADQAEQKVLGADVVVVQPLGLFMGQAEHPASPLGEPLHLIGHGGLLRARRIPPASVGFYQKRVSPLAGHSSQGDRAVDSSVPRSRKGSRGRSRRGIRNILDGLLPGPGDGERPLPDPWTAGAATGFEAFPLRSGPPWVDAPAGYVIPSEPQPREASEESPGRDDGTASTGGKVWPESGGPAIESPQGFLGRPRRPRNDNGGNVATVRKANGRPLGRPIQRHPGSQAQAGSCSSSESSGAGASSSPPSKSSSSSASKSSTSGVGGGGVGCVAGGWPALARPSKSVYSAEATRFRLRPIRLRARSTLMTRRGTFCFFWTTSFGCSMRRSDSSEMWINPSTW